MTIEMTMTIDSKLGETEVMCVLTSTNAASGWYISVFGDGEERRDEGVKGVKGKKKGRKGTVEVLAQRQWTVDDSGQFVCGNADHRLGVECLGRTGTMTARPVCGKKCVRSICKGGKRASFSLVPLKLDQRQLRYY